METEVRLGKVRYCAIPGCEKVSATRLYKYWYRARDRTRVLKKVPSREYKKFCPAHARRKTKYGSATARKCSICHKICDDELTVALRTNTPGRDYHCDNCFRERLDYKNAALA